MQQAGRNKHRTFELMESHAVNYVQPLNINCTFKEIFEKRKGCVWLFIFLRKPENKTLNC